MGDDGNTHVLAVGYTKAVAKPLPEVMPSGTLTFLFTDIEGSTRLLRALGDSYLDVLASHHMLIRSAIAAHRGHEVQTDGDAFFVVFEDPSDAVAGALAAQLALLEHHWPDGDLRVRMGLHTGTATLASTGYVGMAIHEAARLAAAAHGGQVLLSDATRALIGNQLPSAASLRDLGLHRLKDFDEPQHVHQLCHPALPEGLPPLRTLAAHNLASSLTPLLGRQRELDDVNALIGHDDIRLLTLTGPGGIGKTRLALAAGEASAHRFRDGVRFVPLAPVADPDLVASAIARAVGLPELQGHPRDVVDRLRDMELLLILDNFEHVLVAGALVGSILEGCRGITALVTSQAVLGLRGERTFPLSTLTIPPPGDSSLEDLQASPGVALFEARAHDAHPQFHLTDENIPAVADICRRLDGLPLAIELAAPRVKLFDPQTLLARLDDRFAVLTGGGPDRASRHQTLEAAIGWSYDLLDDVEQALLRDLSIFVDGFGLEAAEDVAGTAGAAFLNAFASLLDKSLITATKPHAGEMRSSMLESIRAFGHAKLDQAGATAELGERHAAYFVGLAQREAPALTSASRGDALDRLDSDHGNLRSAFEWLIAADRAVDALELAAALGWFWYHRGHFDDGRRSLHRVLSMTGDVRSSPVGGQALTAAARLAYYTSDFDQARNMSDEAIGIATEHGDSRGLAYALYVRALAAQGVSDPTATAFAQDAVAQMRTTSDQWGLALALFYLGTVAIFVGPRKVVLPALAESETIFRELGDSWGVGGALFYRGVISRSRGALAEAKGLIEESVEMFRASGDRWRLMSALAALGELTSEMGGEAAALQLEAKTLRRQLGIAAE